MTEKKDIFDRIMTLPVLRLFNGFYVKNKAVLLYLFFGGLTTVISISSFILIDSVLGINEHIANLCSWILAVLFAYVTNRVWVFASRAKGRGIIAEMGAFFLGRAATLGIEEVILLVFVTVMELNSTWVKIAAQFIVLVANYVLSKFIVFRSGNKNEK